MVRCLCFLHNWLIDEVGGDDIPISTASDECAIVNRGGNIINAENNSVNIMTDGGDHFDDTLYNIRYNHQRHLFRQVAYNPRQDLLDKLAVLGIKKRLAPMGSTSTNNK